VARDAGDLGLMHRVNHRRCRTGAAERVADVNHVADAGALTAEIARDRNAHEALGARSGDRLCGKARVAVDGRSMFHGNCGDLLRTGGETCHSGRNVSWSDLAAHRGARAGNTLQSRRSQMDGRGHYSLFDCTPPPPSLRNRYRKISDSSPH
jgi:hypothetical protein